MNSGTGSGDFSAWDQDHEIWNQTDPTAVQVTVTMDNGADIANLSAGNVRIYMYLSCAAEAA